MTSETEYQRLWRARNRDRLNANKRARRLKQRLENPEKVKAERRAAYARHKEKEKAQHLAWSRRPEVIARRRERQNEWKAANPDKMLLRHAKGIIARRLGISWRQIPLDLAQLKALEMKVNKLLGRKAVN